jgi:hypothetical protein
VKVQNDLSMHLSISQLSELTGRDRRRIAKQLKDLQYTTGEWDAILYGISRGAAARLCRGQSRVQSAVFARIAPSFAAQRFRVVGVTHYGLGEAPASGAASAWAYIFPYTVLVLLSL